MNLNFSRIGEIIVREIKNLQNLPGNLKSMIDSISALVRNPSPPAPKQSDVRAHMNNQLPESTSYNSGMVESPGGSIVVERHVIELNKQMQAIKENTGEMLSASEVKIRGFHRSGMAAIETNEPGSINSEKHIGNTATIAYDREKGQYKLIVTQDRFNQPRGVTFNGQELEKGDEVYFEKGQNTLSVNGAELFKITV